MQVLYRVCIQEIYQERRERQTAGPTVIWNLSICTLCSMHGVMRIVEWQLQMACQGCIAHFGPSAGAERIARLVIECHAYFCGVADKSSTWNITVKNKVVQKPGLCYQRCRKLLLFWVPLMETLFDKEGEGKSEKHLLYDNFGVELNMFVEKLCQSDVFHTEDQIDEMQDIADSWIDVVKRLGLGGCLGNYGHAIGAGHFINQLRRFDGNIYRFCNQDVEAKVGQSKSDERYSQKGGNSGGTNKVGVSGTPFSKAQALYNRNSRRWMDLGNGFKLANEGVLGGWIRDFKDRGITYGSDKAREVLNDNGLDELIDFVNDA